MAAVGTQDGSHDDIFDEESTEKDLAEKQWKKIEAARMKEGFIEGIEKGQDLILQEAFNAGYKQAVSSSYRVAKLRGILSAVLGQSLIADKDQSGQTDSTRETLESLIEELSTIESNLYHQDPSSQEVNSSEAAYSGTCACDTDSKDCCAEKGSEDNANLNAECCSGTNSGGNVSCDEKTEHVENNSTGLESSVGGISSLTSVERGTVLSDSLEKQIHEVEGKCRRILERTDVKL